jgi:hypothetical protein
MWTTLEKEVVESNKYKKNPFSKAYSEWTTSRQTMINVVDNVTDHQMEYITKDLKIRSRIICAQICNLSKETKDVILH